MEHRSGGKFGGDHSTYIDLAAELVDFVYNRPEVSTISPGHLKLGAGVAGGLRKVKFTDIQGGVLLTVRQSRSVQEVRIITRDPHSTKLALAVRARNKDIAISFGKRGE